jgi:hypothetical protein
MAAREFIVPALVVHVGPTSVFLLLAVISAYKKLIRETTRD